MHTENYGAINCNSKSVEDELHFLMYCPRFENHRRELYSNVLNYNAAVLSAEDKCVWILSNEDPSCVREIAKTYTVLNREYLNGYIDRFQYGVCGY
jgi:hypothetical protein